MIEENTDGLEIEKADWPAEKRRLHLQRMKEYWSRVDPGHAGAEAGYQLMEALAMWEFAEEDLKDSEMLGAKLKLMKEPIAGNDEIARFGERWRKDASHLNIGVVEYLREAESAWQRAEWKIAEQRHSVLMGKQMQVLLIVLFIIYMVAQACE